MGIDVKALGVPEAMRDPGADNAIRALKTLAECGRIDEIEPLWGQIAEELPQQVPYRRLGDAIGEWVKYLQTDKAYHLWITSHAITEDGKRIRRELSAALRNARTAAQDVLNTRSRPTLNAHSGKLAFAGDVARHLCTVPGILEVYLFGSTARGEETDESDMDLYCRRNALRLNDPVTYLRLALPGSKVQADNKIEWNGELLHIVLRGRPPAVRDGIDDAILLHRQQGVDAFEAHSKHPLTCRYGRILLVPRVFKGNLDSFSETQGLGEALLPDLVAFRWTENEYATDNISTVTRQMRALVSARKAKELEDSLYDAFDTIPEDWKVAAWLLRPLMSYEGFQ